MYYLYTSKLIIHVEDSRYAIRKWLLTPIITFTIVGLLIQQLTQKNSRINFIWLQEA